MGVDMKQPDQLLHDELFRISEGFGFTTYPYLPSDSASYPFVVMGEIQTLPRATKSRLIGRLSSTVHIWGREMSANSYQIWLGSCCPAILLSKISMGCTSQQKSMSRQLILTVITALTKSFITSLFIYITNSTKEGKHG